MDQKQEIVLENLPFQSVVDIQQLEYDEDDEEPGKSEMLFNEELVRQSSKQQKYDSQANAIPIIVKSGLFQKVSPHLLETNSSYYCTLQSNRFTYYSAKNLDQPQGILDFDWQNYHFSFTAAKDGSVIDFRFQPQGLEKVFHFQVPSKLREEFKSWVPLIQQFIQQSIGYKCNKQSLTKYFRFWRNERIINENILVHAQTGDLIVFRSKGSMAHLQRQITRSDYDHIVMFVRQMSGNLLLLESSNQYGVISFSYTRFVQACSYRNYEKIVYKQLLGLSEDDRYKMIIDSQDQIGKGYSLSLMKFFKKSTRQKFFCSELIAYLYQLIGVIDKNEKCCTFLPGSFTNERKLKLLKNAYLSEDYVIDFYND